MNPRLLAKLEQINSLRHLLSESEVAQFHKILRQTAQDTILDPHGYAYNPIGYAENILGVWLTDQQKGILKSLHEQPCQHMVPSANAAGKTFLGGVVANYWYDSFNPGLVISASPKEDSLKRGLWAEIRILRQRAKERCPKIRLDFIGPQAMEMRSAENHYCIGQVANRTESFQGKHWPNKLFIKDEATGIRELYWSGTNGMFDPAAGDCEINFYNPLDTTSRCYAEETGQLPDGSFRYQIHRLSAFDHPNIVEELQGRRPPVPGAISVAMIEKMVRDMCDPLSESDEILATDVEWPPRSITGKPGKWYRPGPEFQARVLGLWPLEASGVWSDALWEACLKPGKPFVLSTLPQIGCDMALGRNDDYHAIHARWNAVSLFHETSNTMKPARVIQRLKEVALLMAGIVNRERGNPQAKQVDEREIPIKLDDDGAGAVVSSVLQEDGYKASNVNAAGQAQRSDLYPNKRCELWFQTAEKAKRGNVCLSRLDTMSLRRLKQQFIAPAWKLRGGMRMVEPKDITKAKIGRSPDEADAVNLSHYETGDFRVESIENPDASDRLDPRQHRGTGHRLFGGR